METNATTLDIQKKYGSRALILAIAAGLFFLGMGHKDVCRGIVLGGVFSALNFALMGQLLQYRLSHQRKIAVRRSLMSMALRYILLAIPLVVAVRSDRFGIAATVVGIFMVQLVIMLEHGSRFLFTTVKH